VANKLGFSSEITGYAFVNYNAAPGKKQMTTFTQGAIKDYRNSNVYWGTAGAPAAEASFGSLTADQKKVVARALGYEVFEGTSFYKATEPVATRMVQGFHDGNKVDYSLIDWGGVGAPDTANASFEQLSIEQRDFVASQKGYQRYNAQVFYKPGAVAPAKELRTSFTVGTGSAFDVDYDQVDWGSLAKPDASVLFADLRAEQQDVILDKLGVARGRDQQLPRHVPRGGKCACRGRGGLHQRQHTLDPGGSSLGHHAVDHCRQHAGTACRAAGEGAHPACD
jgi:hypothetical protein